MAASKGPRAAPNRPVANRPSVIWPTMGQLWTFVGICLPAMAALLVPMSAVDLAYQLRVGASIIAGEGIPTVDTWTFTVAGTPWLDQQWGAQVLLTLAYQALGWTGLALLRAALVGGTFWLLQLTLRSMGCERRPAALLALGAFVVAAPALALRPQLFAILLFAASMAVIAGRSTHPRLLWLLPVFAALWANLHGSFPLILVLIGLAWLDELTRLWLARAAARAAPTGVQQPARSLVQQRILGSTGIALIGAVAAFATLVNPFGIDAWRYVVNLASNPAISSMVSEWRPPTPLEPAGALFYLSLLIGLAVLVLRIRADGNRVSVAIHAPAATLLAFGLLGVVSGRGLAWWALVLPVAAAALAHDANLTRFASRVLGPIGGLLAGNPARLERRSPLNDFVAILLLAIGVALLPSWRPVGRAGVPLGILTHAPQDLASAIPETLMRFGVSAWVPQTWGSWFEFATPGVDVAVDSRIELFPASVWADYEQVASASGDWLAILERYHVDVVVVAAEQTSLEAGISSTQGWQRLFFNNDGSIWRRQP